VAHDAQSAEVAPLQVAQAALQGEQEPELGNVFPEHTLPVGTMGTQFLLSPLDGVSPLWHAKHAPVEAAHVVQPAPQLSQLPDESRKNPLAQVLH